MEINKGNKKKERTKILEVNAAKVTRGEGGEWTSS